MSRVVVNEIEAKVGNDISFNDTVKIDTIKGKTAASSVTVQGEGTATTNLQQGLAKVLASLDTSGTAEIDNSFNLTSITDNGTGDYTMTMQTAMSNANYSQTCGAGDVDHGAKINIAFTDANTTTAMRIRLAAAVSGNGDSSIVTNHVAGDLA